MMDDNTKFRVKRHADEQIRLMAYLFKGMQSQLPEASEETVQKLAVTVYLGTADRFKLNKPPYQGKGGKPKSWDRSA